MTVSEAIGRPVPFAELLGIEVTQRGSGSARLELSVRPELFNSWGAAHGGVVMTLADVALAAAARTMNPAAIGTITVTMSLTFIGAGHGRLIADARCLRYGASLAFCECEIRDVQGGMVAKALGTFKLRRPPKASPGEER